MYRVRACAHASGSQACPSCFTGAHPCVSVHSGREISKSKIVQLVSSGVSAAYVAYVHRGTIEGDKREKRVKRREKGSEGGERKTRLDVGVAGSGCERRVKDEVSRLWARKRDGSVQKEGGGMRGSRRRSCRR